VIDNGSRAISLAATMRTTATPLEAAVPANMSTDDAYDAFSAMYDRYWSKSFAHWVTPICDSQFGGVAPTRRLLDIGCGSGRLDHQLDALGFDVTGVDYSARMLDLARMNAPACRFVKCDIRHLKGIGPFDAALSLGGTLNHLMTLDDLASAFRSIRSTLVASAPFVLSMTGVHGYRAWWRGGMSMIAPDHVCIADASFDEPGQTGHLLLTIFHLTNGGGNEWARTEAHLVARCYATDQITTTLLESGFADVHELDVSTALGLDDNLGQLLIQCTAS
jgi:SAM-dependent methyltransferase